MAVVSLRLNKDEERIVNFLTNYYDEDKSSVIKHSLKELYEDLLDNKIIDEYERNEKSGNAAFVSGDDILKMLSTT